MEATIETPVVPTNTLLNDLLGALVSHISKSVIQQIQPQLKPAFDSDQLHELIEKYMANRYDHFLDDHIGRWMSSNFDISDYEDDIDVDSKIDEWMSNSFDIDDHINVNEAVSDALDDCLEDKVRDAINDLTFEVRVS